MLLYVHVICLPPGVSARTFPASSLPGYMGLPSSLEPLSKAFTHHGLRINWAASQAPSGTHSKAAASLRKTNFMFFFFHSSISRGRSTRCVSSRASVVKSKSLNSWLRRQSPDLFSRPPAMKPAKVSLAEPPQGCIPKCDSVSTVTSSGDI